MTTPRLNAELPDWLATREKAGPEIIELTATVAEGQLAFHQPAPLPVQGNEIDLGDRRIIIHLISQPA